jgi:CHASE3 domain sensor protein
MGKEGLWMQRKIIIALAIVILVVSLISGLIYVQQQSSPSKSTRWYRLPLKRINPAQ